LRDDHEADAANPLILFPGTHATSPMAGPPGGGLMAQLPLADRACKPCEGGAEPLPRSAAQTLLQDVPRWELIDGKLLRRTITCRNFLEASQLFQRIAAVAEAEDHHPDLHLTNFRTLTIDLSTHAIGGLSENDFILAAKISALIP